MRKKVDLNAPRNNQNDYKSRNNHSFSHGVPSNNASSNTEDNSSSTSSLKQKASEKGLRMAGMPKASARLASNYVNDMDTSDKIKAVIKFVPPQVKVVLVALIIGLPLVGLMLFVVLFSDAGATDISDYISLAESCSTITVTNTGCDSIGNNCTHVYDGEVDFEDYIAGVVAGIGDGAQNSEFYKAISVMARTYFLGNLSDSCEVNGNSSFMEYKTIDDAIDEDIIKNAVSDTSKMVLVNSDNELVSANYSMACVVNSDSSSYDIRYGMGNTNYQKVPISFDNDSQIYRGRLNSLYNTVDRTNTNYENRACPLGNDSNGLSLIGALYLAKNEGYKYSDILEYYYGDVTEAKAEGTFNGNQVDGFINPVNPFPYCTSSFGCRLHPIQHTYRTHGGIDIAVGEGTVVYATKSGIVSEIKTDIPGPIPGSTSYGNYILINHGDGTMTRYAHLKYGGVMVSVGTMVNQGQAIALSGNTGGSTGPHLHYEVYVNGVRVDPYNYLDTSVIGDAGSCNYGKSVDASYCGR